MDLPLIGTVDLTPSGLFLAFAALVAVGYLGWQIFGARRALARARTAEEGAEEGAQMGVQGAGDDASAAGDDAARASGDDESHPR